MASALGARWKQNVIVENIGGADGLLGTQRALRAPADGHMLVFQLANSMLLWKALFPNQPDMVSELKFISIVQRAPLAFAVRGDHPATTLPEFIELCRKRPCSAGSGTSYAKLVVQDLFSQAGLRNAVTAVYKGGGPMLNDLLGGHIDIGTPSAAAVQAQLNSGAIRFLAVGSRERFPGTPGVPTVNESGYAVFGESVYGLMAARSIPTPVLRELVEAVQAVSTDAALVAAIRKSVAQPVFSDAETFEAHMRLEGAYLEPLIKKHAVASH